jgi:hypothetical protein
LLVGDGVHACGSVVATSLTLAAAIAN